MGTLLAIWSNFYFQCFFKIVLITILAGIIGMERDRSNKPAGFRTYILLGLSAVLVILCGEALSQKYDMDPFRIAAQFLSGIGFIGAGTILRDGFNVKGLTTASGLLTISCIGLCVGAGFYFGAIIATVFTYIILSYSYIFIGELDHYNVMQVELDTTEEVSSFMEKLEAFCEEYELEIQQIKDITDFDLEYNTLRVTFKYNNKMLTKNKILTQIASIENLTNINSSIK